MNLNPARLFTESSSNGKTFGPGEKNLENSKWTDSLLDWLGELAKVHATFDIPDIPASIGTSTGPVRKENQDRPLVCRLTNAAHPERSFIAAVICDGMGGMVDGSRCAEIAVTTFIENLTNSGSPISVAATQDAARRANDEVFRKYRGRGGTTLTAVIFSADGNTWAITVGDSRLYRFSSANKIEQVSIDDTIAGELQRLTGREPSSASLEPFSSRLAQYIGVGEGMDPRIYTIEHDPHGEFLLASDGLQTIPPDTLQKVVSTSNARLPLTTRLLNLANWCGGHDNTSIICIGSEAKKNVYGSRKYAQSVLEIWNHRG
jgi:PPM family protein phosphatase